VGDPGGVAGAYAKIRYADDGPRRNMGQFAIRTREELDRVQANAQARGGAVWKTYPDEMRIKVAVKYLSKFLPQTPALERAVAYDNAHFGNADADNEIVEPPPTTKAALTAALTGATPATAPPVPSDDEEPGADGTLFPDVPYDGPREHGENNG